MIPIKVIIFGLFVFCDITYSQDDVNCNPASACKQPGIVAGSKVPDPDDCHNYFLCITLNNDTTTLFPSNNPVSCPETQHFDVDAANCVPLSTCTESCLNLNCEYNCDPSTSTIYPVADPFNCNKFYLCVPGSGLLEQFCPNENYFDGEECQENPYKCCDGCVPYCDKANIEVMDPLDCEMYYLCDEEGVPDEERHYKCGDGQYFDSTRKQCVPNLEEPCKALCASSETVPPITTSVTPETNPKTTPKTETSSSTTKITDLTTPNVVTTKSTTTQSVTEEPETTPATKPTTETTTKLTTKPSVTTTTEPTEKPLTTLPGGGP